MIFRKNRNERKKIQLGEPGNFNTTYDIEKTPYVLQKVHSKRDKNYKKMEYNAKVNNLEFMALCCSGKCPQNGGTEEDIEEKQMRNMIQN